MKIIKPPTKHDPKSKKYIYIFLAGSIEGDTAERWQDEITELIKKIDENNRIIVMNPRRDEWDSSWKQDIKNSKFREQVEWELQGLEMADVVALYFDPSTKSPISLLELGLHAKDNKMIICCPKGFWRKGNVDVVANKYKVPVIENKNKFFKSITNKLVELM